MSDFQYYNPMSWFRHRDYEDMHVRSTIIVQARNVCTVALGIAQLALAFLALINHLNITVPVSHPLYDALASDNFWSGVFLTSGLLTIVSMFIVHLKSVAMAYAASALFSWGVFQLLYALDTVRPVSYAGPVLAICVSPVGIALANSWAVLNLESKLKGV